MDVRYRFRIYPTKEQEAQIRKNFGCVRFVYNYFLNKRIERYKAGLGIYGFYESCKDLTALKNTEGYEWLKEADAHSLQKALKHMDEAYTAFFRRLRQKNGPPGYPRFKKKTEARQSYTSSQTGNFIRFTDKEIKLPKLGMVKCRISKKIEGRIRSASVIQVPSGKYYVSVCFAKVEPEQFPKTDKVIGLHFGIRALAVTSDGEIIENPRFLEKAQQKISRLQRELSRKEAGSANYKKARLDLAKVYEHITQSRTDALQKLTTRLVKEYDIICVRDVDVSRLHKWPYSFYMTDAAWGELVQLLQYKCQWYGKRLVKVEASYPSAQLCSACGFKNIALAEKKSQTWICPNCGVKHERAHNAAKNILARGLCLVNAICDDVVHANAIQANHYYNEETPGTGGQSETKKLAENA